MPWFSLSLSSGHSLSSLPFSSLPTRPLPGSFRLFSNLYSLIPFTTSSRLVPALRRAVCLIARMSAGELAKVSRRGEEGKKLSLYSLCLLSSFSAEHFHHSYADNEEAQRVTCVTWVSSTENESSSEETKQSRRCGARPCPATFPLNSPRFAKPSVRRWQPWATTSQKT